MASCTLCTTKCVSIPSLPARNARSKRPSVVRCSAPKSQNRRKLLDAASLFSSDSGNNNGFFGGDHGGSGGNNGWGDSGDFDGDFDGKNMMMSAAAVLPLFDLAASADTKKIIVIILDILIPVLGVFIYNNKRTDKYFWTALVLTFLPPFGIVFALAHTMCGFRF